MNMSIKPDLQSVMTIIASFILFVILTLLTELSPETMRVWSLEDGLIENTSAFLFFISGIGFFIVAVKSDFIKEKNSKWAYTMTLAWALLMFIFAGEEISWGQRIFGFATPEVIQQSNTQNEFNIHNLAVVDSFLGGKYRYLSIMMLTTGLILPLAVLNTWGRKICQFFAFPVSPLRYALLFVGAYVFGKYYHAFPPESVSERSLAFVADETRELVMAIAMTCFALHGVVKPGDLFRADKND